MAFSNVAASSGTAGGNSTSASVTITAPSSGDLVVFWLNSNSTTAPTVDSDSGAAWTTAGTGIPSGKTAQYGLAWKVANGSEPTSYSWTVGSAQWRVVVFTFSAAATPVVDAAMAYELGTISSKCVVGAIDGEVISDDAVSLVFCGKDTRGSSEAIDTADNSYTGVLGNAADQVCCGSYRIYTTGTTFSGSVTMETADGGDVSSEPYGVHISFVESGGGSSAGTLLLHGIQDL